LRPRWPASEATADAAKSGADKALTAASAAGEAIPDTWITAKLKAKFVDEKVLDGSDISVETKDHLVTLGGTVGSPVAKDRAAEIALGTEGVVRVVNEIVVK